MDRGYVVQARHRARPDAFSRSRSPSCSRSTSAASSTTSFTARMEDDLDRIAAGDEDGSSGCAGSTSATASRTRRPARRSSARSARSTRAPSTRSRSRRNDIVASCRALRAVRRARRGACEHPARPRPRRAHAREGRPSCSRSRQAIATLGVHPETGRELLARTGRYGPYVTEVLPEDDKGKPKTASLFKSMSLDTVTLDDALQLLSLPRVARPDPATARRSRAERPLRAVHQEGHGDPLARDRGAAVHDHARAGAGAPRQAEGAPGRGAPRPPAARARRRSDHRASRSWSSEGRFGPYVTDGETNASLRAGDDVESLTLERAIELLADRRARGPAKPAGSELARRRKLSRAPASLAERNASAYPEWLRRDGIRSFLFESSIVGIRLRSSTSLWHRRGDTLLKCDRGRCERAPADECERK